MDAFRICLLKQSSLFGFPNKRILIILFSFSLKMLASIVAIRNFNNITRKHINKPCVFCFNVILFKPKTFQAHFCRKQTLLPDIQLVKSRLFPAQQINVKKVLNVCSVRKPFFCKIDCFQQKNLQTDTSQSTLNRKTESTTLKN